MEWGISLKLDFKGIRFNIWLYYMMFALGILAILGLLQTVMIQPYYRENKISMMQEVADAIEASIIDKPYTTITDVDTAVQVVVDNNACAIIYNEKGDVVYRKDSLGVACIFSQPFTYAQVSYDSLDTTNSLASEFIGGIHEVSKVITNDRVNQEMILYGRKINAELQNYYLYINSPVELLQFTVQIFQAQFVVLTIGVLVLSLIISIFFSQRISSPIVDIRKNVKNLELADYSINFEGGSFTETKDLADSLNAATQKLSKVDELRKDLIANVSHDIKTPLTMIKAYAEMIQDISGNIPEKREEHLSVIVQEAEYLDHLVTELSELSKMQSGTYDLNLSQFDLAVKVKEIVRLCQGLFEQHSLHCELVTPDRALVSADETKIGQVIYNYISNAIKHSEDHTNIYITCQDFGDTVRVSVQDEGPGIPEAEIEYIWDRYYKIDKGFKRSTKGTGLGLAIVKAILDTHGAHYGVESQIGRGSCFWFELTKEDAK